MKSNARTVISLLAATISACWLIAWALTPGPLPVFRAAKSIATDRGDARFTRMTFTYGDTVDRATLQRARAQLSISPSWLLVAVVPLNSQTASRISYFKLLEQKYRANGLIVHIVRGPPQPGTDPMLDALGLASTAAATMLVDSQGVVHFAARRTLTADNARLLVERQIIHADFVPWPALPTDVNVWSNRIAAAHFTNRDSASIPDSAVERLTHMAVFDASCSLCVLRDQLSVAQVLASLLKTKEPHSSLAIVLPDHYRDAVLASIDSSARGLQIWFTKQTLSPELGYVSRDDRVASRPVVLQLDRKQVVRMGRLGREHS
jgi:hypothetical protein